MDRKIKLLELKISIQKEYYIMSQIVCVKYFLTKSATNQISKVKCKHTHLQVK